MHLSTARTGRSTRALQGINGLLLEELAAAHLRSKLTNNSPEEFQKLISIDTSTKKSTPKTSYNDTSESSFSQQIKKEIVAGDNYSNNRDLFTKSGEYQFEMRPKETDEFEDD